MVVPRSSSRGGAHDGDGNGTAAVSDYEKIREQRIKENLARMQTMGIFDLSRQLNSFKPAPNRPRRNPPSDQPKAHRSTPTRRSSRLQNVAPVDYNQSPRKPKRRRERNPSQNVRNPIRKRRSSSDSDSETDSQSASGSDLDYDSNSDSDTEVKIRVPIVSSGSPPRRSCRLRDVAPVSYVETTPKKERVPSESVEGESSADECGEEGESVDDGVKDETCHQCRQRTLGDLTHCSKCDLVQGQFCGDCLDMRYGENVTEANQNPDWVCPVCRGICNCSVCLTKKTQELMHDDIREEMEERKEVNVLVSEHVPAEDVGKLDAATLTYDVDGETKKDPKRSTRASSAHVVAKDMGKLDAAGDVDGESNIQPRRSTRTSIMPAAAEDLGNLDAAGDVVDGETEMEPRRSTRMRRN